MQRLYITNRAHSVCSPALLLRHARATRLGESAGLGRSPHMHSPHFPAYLGDRQCLCSSRVADAFRPEDLLIMPTSSTSICLLGLILQKGAYRTNDSLGVRPRQCCTRSMTAFLAIVSPSSRRRSVTSSSMLFVMCDTLNMKGCAIKLGRSTEGYHPGR